MNIYGNVNAGTHFQHKLLPTDRVIANICKSFTNISIVNAKSSKTKISKNVQ